MNMELQTSDHISSSGLCGNLPFIMETSRTELNMRKLIELFIIKPRLWWDKSNNKGPTLPELLSVPLTLII